jgi:uncharacterized membrane protein YraQ (UPF0718 family)
VEAVGKGLFTAAGLLWTAAWALVLGYAFSAVIQVFVRPQEAADKLGEAGPKQVGLAMGLGFVSSSCSFAALAATRSLLVKGARLETALAFLFASTNLVIELAVLLWIFLGWRFVLALYIGAFILVTVMILLVRLTLPRRLLDAALERARQVEDQDMQASGDLPASWRQRLRRREAWARAGDAFVGEWRMAAKEILLGFLVAGFIAALVPPAFFQAIFPQELPAWLLAPVHAVIAPLIAVLTVIGSLGNGPLAAVFWENGVAFAGVMAFLASDFIVPPSLKINANYYGWRFAVYLGLVVAAAAVVSGVTLQALFAALGLIPERGASVTEMATFGVDYTLFLNVLAALAAATLLWLRRRTASAARAAPRSAQS